MSEPNPSHLAVEGASRLPKDATCGPAITADSLGSAAFREDYGVRFAYAAGSMYRGVASSAMVIRMAKAGILSFLGTGGLPLTKIRDEIGHIRKELPQGQVFGVNLLHQPSEPWIEEEQVDFYIRENVQYVEASAYMQNLSLPLIRYRLSGATRNDSGVIRPRNRILAKVSRPEVATAFMSPAPETAVRQLLERGLITVAEADIAARLPMADDVCVEADSGGHTDRGVASVLLPAMILLRDELMTKHRLQKRVRVGSAGGIGTPASAAAAFVMGADFIVTGSINQCTVEAGTSDQVKDLLQSMNIQDTDYAPAGDMFELGSKVQVLKRGILFPARANKLYELYRAHDSLDDIDSRTRQQLEERYFRRTLDEIYEDTRAYYGKRDPRVLDAADSNPKLKMALVFRWYFGYTNQLALSGVPERTVDYQIHTGPALGAFNQWVRDTPMADWRNRHVDEIAIHLLDRTAQLLNRRFLVMAGVAPDFGGRDPL